MKPHASYLNLNQKIRTQLVAMIYGLAMFWFACYVDVAAHLDGQDQNSLATDTEKAADGNGIKYFEKHVRPLLVNRCLKCHSVGSESIGGNLLLDSKAGWSKGGDLGPALQPGNPGESLLIDAITHGSGEIEMPPDGKLSKHEITILTNWIKMGAPDPRTGKILSRQKIDVDAGRSFWAFVPHHSKNVHVPPAIEGVLAHNELDRFIHEKQNSHGVRPVGRSSKRQLIRRVTVALTGLLPEPEEVEAFVNDKSPHAYEMLVDRLLGSPRYGEVWGRHWLDVARYADSNGLDENIAHGNAWHYRDYVIRSFNSDKSYADLVREQLAGDFLVEDVSEKSDEQFDLQIATGFLSLGPKVLAEVDETKMEMDIVDEQVDTVGRAFMALTLGCARCHDHKFDPIRTEDYYAVAGIFKSTKTMEHFTKIAKWNEVEIANHSQLEKRQTQLNKIKFEKQNLDKLKGALRKEKNADKKKELTDTIVAKEKQIANLEANKIKLPTAMSVTEYSKPVDLNVHIRGSHLTQGEKVRRGVPAVLNDSSFSSPKGSGRLELANWLTNGKHPLTARVIVNRVWRWHFGRGIVESTDNFGELGSRPTHGALLDWLANRFVADGWSIKNLHRLILNSSTYQLSSDRSQNQRFKDSDNVLMWHASIQRMEAEAIRDTMLQVAGIIDLKMGGSQLHVENRKFLFDHTSKDLTKYDAKTRSVYLPVIRNHLYDGFQLFDYSDASVPESNRTSTVVAPQALFMMNSPLAKEATGHFARRVMQASAKELERHQQAYLIALGRMPTQGESTRDLRFIQQLLANKVSEVDAWKLLCQTILMSNEFVFIQ